MNRYQAKAKEILDAAGITIQGDNPWDIQVHNPAMYQRVIAHGSLGLGESYMDGWWDAVELDEFFYRILRAQADSRLSFTLKNAATYVGATLINMQKKSRAFEIGRRHYDIGNELYQQMLDSRMVYSCGYWKDATDLEQAQADKLDLICRKLQLQKGQKILDIGCGWGSLMKYAVERYGVTAVGVTVSKQQLILGKEMCAGLPIEFRLQDYRQLNETFDHIVSVGMFEHVGQKNYRTYMNVVARNLKKDGLFLLHTIGAHESMRSGDPWIERYIFPNSMLPSPPQIGRSIERIFTIEDWHNFGSYYDPTLLAWSQNFERAWPRLKDRYDQRFYRMWRYYLLSFAGSFRARRLAVWQIVLAKQGVPGGYQSIR